VKGLFDDVTADGAHGRERNAHAGDIVRVQRGVIAVLRRDRMLGDLCFPVVAGSRSGSSGLTLQRRTCEMSSTTGVASLDSPRKDALSRGRGSRRCRKQLGERLVQRLCFSGNEFACVGGNLVLPASHFRVDPVLGYRE
jgi:hypothetical protein